MASDRELIRTRTWGLVLIGILVGSLGTVLFQGMNVHVATSEASGSVSLEDIEKKLEISNSTLKEIIENPVLWKELLLNTTLIYVSNLTATVLGYVEKLAIDNATLRMIVEGPEYWKLRLLNTTIVFVNNITAITLGYVEQIKASLELLLLLSQEMNINITDIKNDIRLVLIPNINSIILRLGALHLDLGRIEDKIDLDILPALDDILLRLDEIENSLFRGIEDIYMILELFVKPKLNDIEGKIGDVKNKIDNIILPKLNDIEGKIDMILPKLDFLEGFLKHAFADLFGTLEHLHNDIFLLEGKLDNVLTYLEDIEWKLDLIWEKLWSIQLELSSIEWKLDKLLDPGNALWEFLERILIPIPYAGEAKELLKQLLENIGVDVFTKKTMPCSNIYYMHVSLGGIRYNATKILIDAPQIENETVSITPIADGVYEVIIIPPAGTHPGEYVVTFDAIIVLEVDGVRHVFSNSAIDILKVPLSYETSLWKGQNQSLFVDALNPYDQKTNITVTTFYDKTPIGSQTVTLEVMEETTVRFDWETSTWPAGTYTKNITVTYTDPRGCVDTYSGVSTFEIKEPSAIDVYTSVDAVPPQGEVKVYAKVTYYDEPLEYKPVAFEIIDPHGTSIDYRSALTDANGIANTSFRIPTNATFGDWTVYATADIAETTVNDTLTFKVGWIVEITQVEAVDIHGNPKTSFTKGEHMYFNLTVQNIAFTSKKTTLTIVAYDECGVPIGLVTLQDWVIGPGITEIFIIDLQIPDWAFVGVATIYANAYTDPPTQGGTPTCPEKTTTFIITKT